MSNKRGIFSSFSSLWNRQSAVPPELDPQEDIETRPQMDPTLTKRDSTTWSAGITAPSCPKCGKPMIGRTLKRGPKAGSSFWGCSAFPECTGMREI